MKTLAITLTLGALALSGCAALDVARERVGSRLESLVEGYCEQPASVRAVARVEANEAVKDRATVVVACMGEPGYEELRHLYVDPLGENTLDALAAKLLERGQLTLPNGTRLKVVIEDGAQP